MGTCQCRDLPEVRGFLIFRSSGPVPSGCRQALALIDALGATLTASPATRAADLLTQEPSRRRRAWPPVRARISKWHSALRSSSGFNTVAGRLGIDIRGRLWTSARSFGRHAAVARRGSMSTAARRRLARIASFLRSRESAPKLIPAIVMGFPIQFNRFLGVSPSRAASWRTPLVRDILSRGDSP
jgi:hypothetical protein